ncbi:MAG TPA: helix-turn-helix transcriptional regulator [Noviherbaspirillum sp.]|jgi:DNA-binding CsgD family transcriptional regulator
MLHRLSKAVAELYALAENTEPDQFREELLALLHTLIRFDGAVLESGDINLTLRPADDAPQETATQRIAALLRKTDHDRYLASTAACIGRLSAPYACDKSRLSQHELPWLRDLGTAPGFRKLLLFGDLPASRPWPRWLLLYRDGERDFSDEDANLLHAVWRHVTRAIDANLRRALHGIDAENASRALAFVSSRGIIETADPNMAVMLDTEWPGFDGLYLPQHVVSALLITGHYRGKQIEISATHKFGYMVCTAKPAHAVSSLSPSEMNAVRRFANGMSHSEIAAQLGISRHTVRNQIANAYQKLGIHNKVELVRLVSSM